MALVEADSETLAGGVVASDPRHLFSNSPPTDNQIEDHFVVAIVYLSVV